MSRVKEEPGGISSEEEDEEVHWSETSTHLVVTEVETPTTREPVAMSTPHKPGAGEPDLAADEALAEARMRLADTQNELHDLKQAFRRQQAQMSHLEDDLHRSRPGSFDEPRTTSKMPLPIKYEGETDFRDYLIQFEALARVHGWDDQMKAVMLLGRLKGKALAVAAKGSETTFSAMVARLINHFSPDHEEMYAQQLQAVTKKPEQSWEDLAYQVRDLAARGYKAVGDEVRDRLAVQAFINAITDDHVRQKVRDIHPRGVEEALRSVRQVEADQVFERQRRRQVNSPVKKTKDENVRVIGGDEKIKQLEKQVKDLQMKLEKKDQTAKAADQAGRVPRPGARGGESWRRRPRRMNVCWYCGGPDHFQRECPMKFQQQMSQGPPAQTDFRSPASSLMPQVKPQTNPYSRPQLN